ncbi:MAG: AAC(3) family N-acetyltransferase [Eubacterium sp.]|nr:AAC(3) family N-acetyltransferase [Eubacterium sp.]
MNITKQNIINGLLDLGLKSGDEIEVHSSLSSFGYVDGGAETVISALKEIVGESGSIFMPALRFSKELSLTEQDKSLGITTKIRILPEDCEHSAMGIIADTFRKMPDTITNDGIFRISAWGKSANEVKDGLQYLIHNGGKALMLGVDIYKLTAMHYVENLLPDDIKSYFPLSDEINNNYPPNKWLIEAGTFPRKPWYTIHNMAYEKGVIKDGIIGNSKVMFFDIWDVVGLYAEELKNNPYKLYGLED